MYVCMYIYIYIYIHIQQIIKGNCLVNAADGADALQDLLGAVGAASTYTPNLPANMVDFRGFDSSTILNFKGGIPRPIGIGRMCICMVMFLFMFKLY